MRRCASAVVGLRHAAAATIAIVISRAARDLMSRGFASQVPVHDYNHEVVKVGTWNVNGIRARQAQLQEWIEREQPSVVCLQEIKASPDQLPVWLCEIEGYWCYWHGAKGYSGV